MNKLFTKIATLCVGLAMAVGVGVAAGSGDKNRSVPVTADEGDIVYTLTCSQNSSNTAYASSFDRTITDNNVSPSLSLDWSTPGNQNAGSGWRVGGAKGTNVKRYITGKSAINKVIKKITVNHNGVSNSNLTINSFSVTVAEDADYSKIIETVTKNNPSVSSAGSFDLDATSSTKWAAGSYYKFTLTYTHSKSSNYGLDLTSLVFYEGYTPSDVPTKGTLAINHVADDKLNVGQTGTFDYSLTGGSQTELSSASWRSSDSSVVEITNSSTGAYVAKKAGSVTIYLSGSDADGFTYDEVSYPLNVELGDPGTRYNPYSVSTAKGKSGESGVYTTGIISSITEVSTGFGNATYSISDDGNTEGQMLVYRGKYLDNASFESEDQIQIGDIVVVYGNLTTYNDATQYGQGNYLVSLKSEARLTLSSVSIEVTVGTDVEVNATPTNFDEGTISYSFDADDCATLSYSGNTITVHGNEVGSHTFTVSGIVGGNTQATAELEVSVVAPYPTGSLGRNGYTSYTDTQTFAQGNGTLTVSYSDGSSVTKHLGDTGVKLYISDVEIPVNTSTAGFVGANSNTKISYTEGDHTVWTNNYTLNVNAELEVTSFEDVPDYLIIDSTDPKHSADVTVNYKSLNGEPELNIVSSNPDKLTVTFDEEMNEYNSETKAGVAIFTIAASGSSTAQVSVTVSVTYGLRTESKSFSVNVRGEAPADPDGSYDLVSTYGEIENGTYVIAGYDGSAYYGMTTSLSSGKLAHTALTVSSGSITSTVTDSMKFTITKKTGGGYTIMNGSNYVGLPASNSASLTVGTTNKTEWTVSQGVKGTFRFTNPGWTSRGLVYRSTAEAFSGYALSNVTAQGTDYFDIELFKYNEAVADSFDLVSSFVETNMHMSDVSIGNNSDTGACKGNDGYYLTAKKAWNAMVTAYEEAEGKDDLVEVFETSFEDAYARYLKWAIAMNDAAPFDGNDDVQSYINAPSAITFRNMEESSSVSAIIIVASIATVTAIGGYFFLRRKKHI